jgi:4-amino-4-deoxy-L-arabinose transferase-like glycosyltransferase
MFAAANSLRGAFRANRWLLAVLALALVVRVYYLNCYFNLPDWDQLTVDNYYHHHWAQSIADGNVFGDTTYFRAPFYVFCLGFLYAVFGGSLWVARLFGLAVGLGSIVMTYLLGRRIFNHKVGLLAALVQSIYPVMVYFEAELLLDPLFTLLLQMTVYRLLVWHDAENTTNAFSTGLFLGLASITRPTALVFIPFIVVLRIVFFKKGRLWAKPSAIFVIAVLVVIAPIFVRNLVVAHDPVLIASQGGINLYIGNNEDSDGVSAVLPEPLGHNWQIKNITHIAEQEAGRSLKPGEVSSYWARRAVSWIAAHPLAFMRLYAEKIYHSLSNREISNNRNLYLFVKQVPILKNNPLSFGFLFILAMLGIAAGFRQYSHVRLLSLLMMTYVFVIAIFFFNSRFRLPLLPYFAVLASYGFVALIQQVRSRQKSSIGLLLAGAAGAFFSFYPVVRLPQGNSPLPVISKGLYYYANGDYRRALHHHRSALAVDSTFPEANLNMGVCFLKLGQGDSARHYFEREKQWNPGRARAFTNIASLHQLRGEYGDAISEVSQALARKPYDVTANIVLLRAASQVDEINSDSLASLVARAAEKTGNDINLLNDGAVLLTQRGALQQAESFLLKALNVAPPAIETNDEAFTQVFRNSPENWKTQRAKAYHQIGYISGLGKRYHDAVRYSELAIESDSTLVDAYVNLISGLLSIGQMHKADSVLAVSLERFPDNKHLRQLKEYLSK